MFCTVGAAICLCVIDLQAGQNNSQNAIMTDVISGSEKRVYIVLILVCIAVYLTGWCIPLMEVDAVQYANISSEMLLHKSFLQVFDQGHEYLDKPPMLFWLSSLSMWVFGINDGAYRLPSFLFSILSIYSTYKLAMLYYPQRLALLAALILASCQAMFLINHDVRTDTMLMGWVITSLWQLAAWLKTSQWKNLLLAAVAIAGGMLTKGPLALMIPVFAFVPHILLRRDFKDLFRWQYLVLAAVIAILLVPMSIGLYQQFDLHPEKTVNGLKNVSGLRFFYWTQSFGRITGENVWHENDSFFFLLQNMLWSFLPWILFFMGGMIYSVRHLIKQRFLLKPKEEWISMGGFIITYCALGSSRAQLPHYIFVVYPLAAIITAKFVYSLLYTDESRKLLKPLFVTHVVIFILLGVALAMLLYFPFPPVPWVGLLWLCVLSVVIVTAIIKKWLPIPALITLLVAGVVCINVLLNTGFYPRLLQYQTGIAVNNIIKSHNLQKQQLLVYKIDAGRSLDFYGNYSFAGVDDTATIRQNNLVLTNDAGLQLLNKNDYRLVYSGREFHVTKLTLRFLNPAKRYKETKPFYILQRL